MFSLGQAFSKPETTPLNYWDQADRYFYPNANAYRRFIQKGGEQESLYNQFKADYLGNKDSALANAKIYEDYTRGLFANQPNQFDSYKQVGDYLYGKIDSFSNSLKDSGLRDMNARLSSLGIRPGSTGYDRLLNATRITNNLAPAFANTTNAIGRDYNNLNANSLRDVMLRVGLANDDALSGYRDSVYRRPLDVADARFGQLSANNKFFQDLVNGRKSNVAGFETKETSDLAKGIGVVDNLLNGAVDLYSSYLGGGMGGLGGMGGAGGGGSGGINPYSFGAVTGMTPNSYMPPQVNPQQSAALWNEMYNGFGPNNNYLGDINMNPYLMGLS